MNLAIFDPVGNRGGGSRFLEQLVPALKRAHPDWEVTFFANPGFLRREGNRRAFESAGVRLRALDSARLTAATPFGWSWFPAVAAGGQQHLHGLLRHFPITLSGDFRKEAERKVRGFDLAYFPWPYLIECPDTPCPKVATFHDFNFKYFFGTKLYSRHQLDLLDRETPRWLRAAWPVVSTEFMRSEAKKWFPEAPRDPRVVRMAPLVQVIDVPEREAAERVDALGIPDPYLVYPCHLCGHKNILNLVMAVHRLRNRGKRIHLVITGSESELCSGTAGPIGIERRTGAGQDVFGLGYVDNRTMNALFQRAAAVITPSYYEAGNGPGMDGWVRGVPVLMSDIPPFREHEPFSGVRAGLFDPSEPASIADAIERLLDDPGAARENARISREGIRRHSWDTVALAYGEVFLDAVAGTS
ncbi:MAG: glycosyltransferase [Kiritimatiellia bacterium]